MSKNARIVSIACAAVLITMANGARAHELWIEPERYDLPIGEKTGVDMRIGQFFKGDATSYIPTWITWFRIEDSGGVRDIAGRVGDRPAANLVGENEGLAILTYYSTANSLVFRDRAIFEKYVDFEGLDGVLERHAERGLPETGFRERYWRCAKSLITVGDVPSGSDKATGMPAEFVAQENPYEDTTPESLRVLLLWEGKPLGNRQVNVFRKGLDERAAIVRTDEAGIAEIPTAEPGAYLINAVQILDGVTDPGNSPWESWWASLTFERRD